MNRKTMLEFAEIKRGEFSKERSELKEYADNCCLVLSKPGGLFGNKCPECGHKLELIKHSWNPCFMTGLQLWEKKCAYCDYRFVEERNFS